MMKQKLTLILLATLMISVLAVSVPVKAAEFSAVLFSIHPNGDIYPEDTLKPNFWVKGGLYRYEGTFQEKPITIISNRETDSSYFLDHERKSYLLSVRSEGGLPDPMAAWEIYFTGLEKQKLGTETIKNYPCTKYKYTADNGVWAMEWVSDSLGMYIKQITHYNPKSWTSTELVNITPTTIDDSLFVIPKDYVDVKTLPPEPNKKIQIPGQGRK